MSEEIRVNRPTAPTVGGQRYDDSSNHHSHGSNKMPWIVLIIVVVIILGVGVIFREKIFGITDSKTDKTKLSGYQAVFLTNGQVYFGKISHINKKYATLKDIYYLQVTQGVQGSGTQGQTAQQQQANQQLQLVKLGKELHGPDNVMTINTDQILFFEDMRTDGKVYDAIKRYIENPNAADQGAQGQNQTPPTQQTPPATQGTPGGTNATQQNPNQGGVNPVPQNSTK